MAVQSRRLSRVELVAEHLKQRGHISEGSALVEYGRFRLADAIYRLRRERSDLIPEDMEIITMNKNDTQGNGYGEYHLVRKASAVTREQIAARARQMVAKVRRQLDTTEHRLAYRDERSLHQSVGLEGY